MLKKAVLAGGCFWGMEELIRHERGVVGTTVGYTGGDMQNPTYEYHHGHAEAVEVEYDTDQSLYRNILDFFFRVHDPTTRNRQGNDTGSSYRSAIFYTNGDERREAEEFIDIVNRSGR
jgi:peptide-methionine (S)-S-oxide reductase